VTVTSQLIFSDILPSNAVRGVIFKLWRKTHFMSLCEQSLRRRSSNARGISPASPKKGITPLAVKPRCPPAGMPQIPVTMSLGVQVHPRSPPSSSHHSWMSARALQFIHLVCSHLVSLHPLSVFAWPTAGLMRSCLKMRLRKLNRQLEGALVVVIGDARANCQRQMSRGACAL